MEGHEGEVRSLMMSGMSRMLLWTFYHSRLLRGLRSFRGAPEHITQPGQLTAAFLTDCLRTHGALSPEQAVESFEVETFGGGAVGLTCRLRLKYRNDDGADAPATLVWKSADTTTMADLKSMAFAPVLAREAAVYTHLQDKLPGTLPRCYYAYANQGWAEAGFLLEDLAQYSGGKYNLDASKSQVEAMFRASARLYRVSSLQEWSEEEAAHLKGPMEAIYLYPDHWKAMLDGKTQKWDEYARKYVESDACARLAALTIQPRYFELILRNMYDAKWNGLVHGDARFDNVFFHPDGSALLIDFQTVERSAPGRDIAWGMLFEIDAEKRRKHDKDLVRAYLQELTKDGSVEMTFEELWENFHSGMVYAFMFICLIQNLVNLPDAMHDYMLVTIPRVVDAITDYDLASWLEKQLPASEDETQ